MTRVIFDGLTTAQAEEFAAWLEGQGEQDMATWFDIAETPAFQTDVLHQPKCIERQGDDFIVHCHTP